MLPRKATPATGRAKVFPYTYATLIRLAMTAKILQPILSLLLLVATFSPLSAIQYSTTGDGLWTNPATWGGVVPPNPVGANDTININHLVVLSADLLIGPGGMLNINQPNGILNMTGFGVFNQSNGGGLAYGGLNVFGQLICSYIRNYPFSWVFVEPAGIITLTGDFDNLGDVYVSGTLALNTGNFNHRSGDVWIFSGGDMVISNGDFNNYSTIRNLFPSSCIRLIGGSFINHRGGVVSGNGGVTASVNIDNSANPIVNWTGATWCAGGNAFNVPLSLEDCAGPCNSPLQVELVDFDATVQEDGQVRIYWSTQTEINSSHFIIERTTDLETFEEVAVVQAAGLSQDFTSYETYDEEVSSGMIHYRISEMDQEGSLTVYGQLVSVFVESPEQEFVLFPNPASESVNIRIDDSQVEGSGIVLVDQTGAVVIEKEMGSSEEMISLSDLSPGIYFVGLRKGSKLVSKKLLVQ